MGSGKSSVAKELAAATGWPMVDNDEALQAATGRTLIELASFGPEKLHELEELQLEMACRAPAPVVVTAAASVADRPEQARRLRCHGWVVYLRASPQVLAARVAGTARPWLEPDSLRALQEMYERRDPILRQVADLTVDSGSMPVVELARAVREMVR